MKLHVLILSQNLDLSDKNMKSFLPYISNPHIAHTIEEALLCLKRQQYSLIIIEVSPPWLFASEPLVIIRAATDIPILALVRGRNIDDFRRCREVANDCVWEPFTNEEILARGTALVEHSVFNDISTSTIAGIYCRGLLIMPKYRRVYIGNYEVLLARKEYNILLYKAQNKGQVLSKEQIYTHVWHDDYYENIDSLVGSHIYTLRKKLARYSQEEFIDNIWGVGYRLSEYCSRKVEILKEREYVV